MTTAPEPIANVSGEHLELVTLKAAIEALAEEFRSYGNHYTADRLRDLIPGQRKETRDEF